MRALQNQGFCHSSRPEWNRNRSVCTIREEFDSTITPKSGESTVLLSPLQILSEGEMIEMQNYAVSLGFVF